MQPREAWTLFSSSRATKRKVVALHPQKSLVHGLSKKPHHITMGEPEDKKHRTISKQAELEELWGINTEQEACITGMEDHHATLRELHKRTWNNYKDKRAEYREPQSKIT